MEHIYLYRRLIESLLDFAYKGLIDIEYAALAPLAVLAQRVGLTELVDSCAKAIMRRIFMRSDTGDAFCVKPNV